MKNEQIVAELLAEFQDQGIEPEQLDEAVHTAKEEECGCQASETELDEAGADAADIDNDGLEAQIRYLLEGYNGEDAEGAKTYIRGLVEKD